MTELESSLVTGMGSIHRSEEKEDREIGDFTLEFKHILSTLFLDCIEFNAY